MKDWTVWTAGATEQTGGLDIFVALLTDRITFPMPSERTSTAGDVDPSIVVKNKRAVTTDCNSPFRWLVAPSRNLYYRYFLCLQPEATF